jgi:protein kinase X
MDKSVREESSTSRLNNTKPQVYLSNPRPPLKRALDNACFPPHHPLAGFQPPPQQQPTPHQLQQAARLRDYHNKPPAYVERPSFGLNDFELQDTLGILFKKLGLFLFLFI